MGDHMLVYCLGIYSNILCGGLGAVSTMAIGSTSVMVKQEITT